MDAFRALCDRFAALQGGERRAGRRGQGGEGPRVLVARQVGASLDILARELAMALVLRAHGARPVVSLCDGMLRACYLRSQGGVSPERWGEPCAACLSRAESLCDAAGVEHVRLGDCVAPANVRRLREATPAPDPEALIHETWEGLPSGYHASASLARFYRGAEDAATREEGRGLAREFFAAAKVSALAARGLLEALSPDRVLTTHRQFLETGPLHGLCRMRGVPVVDWMTGFADGGYYYAACPPDPIEDALIMPQAEWETVIAEAEGLSGETLKRELADYFAPVRASGPWGVFENAPQDADSLRTALSLDPDKPVWGIFPHVRWDVTFTPGSVFFKDADDWLRLTIERAADLPRIQWVIRCHPAERLDGTIKGAAASVREWFPTLPDNLRLVTGGAINTYGLLEVLDGAVVIRSTAGIDAALAGKPVITGGVGHYAGRGFTRDGANLEDYAGHLARAASYGPLSGRELHLARVYAHDLFLRRQLTLSPVSADGWRLLAASPDELAPGRDPDLDLFARGVLAGEPFRRPGRPHA